MTNQEVINFLDQVREILLDDKSWLESTIQPINEAFDIAISAVRAQDVPDTNVGTMIYRQAAIGTVKKHYRVDNDLLEVIVYELENLPSAQPEHTADEWCADCKKYDQEKHCCQRFNRVIREAINEAQPKR